MIGWMRGLGIAAVLGWLWVWASAPAALGGDEPRGTDRAAKQPVAEKSAEPGDDQPHDIAKKETPEAAKSPAKTLSEQQIALRNRVRRILTWYARLPINTADNTPGEVLQFCLACGCDAEIRFGGATGNAVSGFGALCFNYPCAGYELLAASNGDVLARVGYGLQASEGELLAAMALSGVPADYAIRLDHKEQAVANLVDYEKKTCRQHADLSLKLIGLAFYVADDASWKDQTGESWTVQRVLKEELARTPSLASPDATNHATALAWAVQRRARSGHPLEEPYQQAKTELAKFEDAASRSQNRDGSWPPTFLAPRSGRGEEGSLAATGRVLAWLAYQVPDDRLDDSRMILAVTFVTKVLEQWSSQWNVTDSNPRDISSVMHALHALRVYDRRCYKPADPPKAESEEAKRRTSESESRR